MKQVPTFYTVIGNGRVARQMCHYLQLQNIPFMQWHRNMSVQNLELCLNKASHVLVLISDSAVDRFIETHEVLLKNKTLVHFSGSLRSKYASSAHPLQSFPLQLFDKETLERIPFIIGNDGPAFSQLLPGFQNPHFRIREDDRAYYHTLCVMANNFTTILWQKLFQEFESRLHIPHTAAFPILEQTLANLKNDFANALTGPLARGDHETLERNIKSLEGDSFQAIFRAFCVLLISA